MQTMLLHKVRARVTDNGSNFLKACHEFETTEEAAPDDLDDGIRFSDMDAVLEMEGDEELHFLRPHQQKGRSGKCTEVQ